MSKEGKKEEDKKERRFSQEQYDILKRCSEKKDMTEWNEWREKHPDEEIFLEGALLSGAHMREASLDGAKLEGAQLGDAYLSHASLQGAEFFGACLRNANMYGASLEEATFFVADLERTRFICGHMENAEFTGSKLRGARFVEAYLNEANLSGVDLEGASFVRAHLEGADFRNALVNGSTLIIACSVDHRTDFRGVGLDSCRIDVGMKELLKYNIRRMNWEDWYKERWFWRWPVRVFWAMSDYGRSTLRVIGVFFILALLFAAVYMNWAYWAPPGIVNNLVVQPEVGEAGWHYFSRALIRPVYFSVVTMTTLGFGDMYANKGSIVGHVLLISQVILGYVLLGALVTRFAVLFTAGGPAGKFAEEKKETF